MHTVHMGTYKMLGIISKYYDQKNKIKCTYSSIQLEIGCNII